MTDHIATKKKLLNITKVSTFNGLLDECMIGEKDKEILRMIYIENKTLDYIADMTGYSLSTIKAKHKSLLNKISKLL